MMKIVAGIDPSSNSFVITVQSPIAIKHFQSLNGMVTNDKNAPKGIVVEKRDSETVAITFPVLGDVIPDKNGRQAKVPVENSKIVDDVVDIIKIFTNCAVKATMKVTEFIPLFDFRGGYSFEELQNDVKEALKAKRNFLVIDTYENYLKGMDDGKYEFNQYLIPFGTSEYCDFAISVIKGELGLLRKKYKDKLKPTCWV